MSRILLGLGFNLGDRRAHLETALPGVQMQMLARRIRVSPVYESPAMLPPDAEAVWDRPYLNIVVEGDCAKEPLELLAALKALERAAGREGSERWAPRPLDIDILRWEGVTVGGAELTIPHPRWRERGFVLDPMKDLEPTPELLALARAHPQHAPLWMAIVNVTPDSFTDGGSFTSLPALAAHVEAVEGQVQILDVGAESTRPGAEPLAWQAEWERLEPVLDFLRARYAGKMLAPRVSVDTRHAETARRALAAGAGMINDVSGLADPEMAAVLAASDCEYVLMHSLAIPAGGVTMPRSSDVVRELLAWFAVQLRTLESHGVAGTRVIVDPGLGFGKTSVQSLAVLRHLEALASLDKRILVGHSRKSFIRDFAPRVAPAERDLESIGIALNAIRRGADILRVHDPIAHIRAFNAWNHANPST